MDLIDNKSDEEIAKSILAEVAKANNELQCASNDIKKARSRLSFLTMVANKLIKRMEIKR
jgi:hypothetical protein